MAIEGFVTLYQGSKSWKKKYLRIIKADATASVDDPEPSHLGVFADVPDKKSTSWFGSSKTTSLKPEAQYPLKELTVVVAGDSVRRRYKREFVVELAFNGVAKPVVFQANSKQEFQTWKTDMDAILAAPPPKVEETAKDSSSSSQSISSSSSVGASSSNVSSSAPKLRTSRSQASGASGRVLQHPLAAESSSSSSSSSPDDSDSSSVSDSESETSSSVTASEAGGASAKKSSAAKTSGVASSPAETSTSKSGRGKKVSSQKSLGHGRSSRSGEEAAASTMVREERRTSVRESVEKLERKIASPTDNVAGSSRRSSSKKKNSSPLEGLGGLVLDTNHLHLDMPVIKPLSTGKLSSNSLQLKSSGDTPRLSSKSSRRSPPIGAASPPWVPVAKTSQVTSGASPATESKGKRESLSQQFGLAPDEQSSAAAVDKLTETRSSHIDRSRRSDLCKSRRISDPLEGSLGDCLGISLHNIPNKRSSMTQRDEQEVAAAAAEARSGDDMANSRASGPQQGDGLVEPLDRSRMSICEREEVVFKWDERMRFYCSTQNGAKVSQLLGEFTAEAVDFSKKFIEHLMYNVADAEVDRARVADSFAVHNGVFYRIVVDAADAAKDEEELALNAAEVRTVRFLVEKMGANCGSFNGNLTVTVDYLGYRTFCQAMYPIEQCDVASGWGPCPREKRKGRPDKLVYMEPGATAKEHLNLVQSALNLKRTTLRLKDSSTPKRIRLAPSQLLHRDKRGGYYLGRPRTSLLVPLAETLTEVDPMTLNFLRPELQARLPFPVSCVPSAEFCRECVDACPQSDTLKKEIVEAHSELKNAAIPDFCKRLDRGEAVPMDSIELRQAMHEAGVNMCFLGQVYAEVSLPYVKHLCLCDAIARVVKRGIRECCHKTESKDDAMHYAQTWFQSVLQYQATVWDRIRQWLQSQYGFAESDVAHVDFSNSIHAPILLQSMCHHCAVRVDADNGIMYPTLRKEWRRVNLFIDFVPAVKTLNYRRVTQPFHEKDGGLTLKTCCEYLEQEQKLAKAWLQGSGKISGEGLLSATSGMGGAAKGLGATNNTALATLDPQSAAESNPVPSSQSSLQQSDPLFEQHLAAALTRTSRSTPGDSKSTTRGQDSSCHQIIDKSGCSFGLESALTLYIETAIRSKEGEEAKNGARFALEFFAEDPLRWLQFASQAYEAQLFPETELSFEQLCRHIELNFGDDHPLLLEMWRRRVDLLGMQQSLPAGARELGEGAASANFTERMEVVGKACELARAVFGKTHYTTTWYFHLAGKVCEQAERWPEAKEQYQQALDLALKGNAPDSFTAGAYASLRDVYAHCGDFALAVECGRKAHLRLERITEQVAADTELTAQAKRAKARKARKGILVSLRRLATLEETRSQSKEALPWSQKLLEELQAVAAELDVTNRASFEFLAIKQAVRLSIFTALPELQHRMRWETKLKDMQRQSAAEDASVDTSDFCPIADLSELCQSVAELIELGRNAVLVGDTGGGGTARKSAKAAAAEDAAGSDDGSGDADGAARASSASGGGGAEAGARKSATAARGDADEDAEEKDADLPGSAEQGGSDGVNASSSPIKSARASAKSDAPARSSGSGLPKGRYSQTSELMASRSSTKKDSEIVSAEADEVGGGAPGGTSSATAAARAEAERAVEELYEIVKFCDPLIKPMFHLQLQAAAPETATSPMY